MKRDIVIKQVQFDDMHTWTYEKAMQLEQFTHLVAGVTRRWGGVSEAPYTSFNIAFHVGDKKEAVLKNRIMLADYFKVQPDVLTNANQVHGLTATYIGPEQIGQGAISLENTFESDAIYTDQKGVPLLLFVADCVPVLLYDAIHQVIAVVHAGWRGAIGHLPVITLQEMKKRFGTKSKDCYVYLGPSIGPDSFEVGEDLAEKFALATAHLGANPNDVVCYRTIKAKGINNRSEQMEMPSMDSMSKPYVNLWNFIALDLQEAGVLSQNITVTTTDSFVTEDCYSYRREQSVCGRMTMFAMLK